MSNFVPVFKKIFSYMENQEYKIFEIEVGIDYPFVGLDDSNLDKGKYITYVEDYEYVGKGDAFDYDMYYYGTTIYS